MTKKVNPIITHTELLCLAIRATLSCYPSYFVLLSELLCLAIRCLENDIEQTRKRYSEIPGAEAAIQFCIDEKGPKIDAIKTMYRIETGVGYD